MVIFAFGQNYQIAEIIVATRTFIANETRRSQSHVITVGGTAALNATLTLTINSKLATYTANATDTIATMITGWANAIRTSVEGEFQQLQIATTATTMTVSATTPGRYFTPTGAGSLTISATGGPTVSQAVQYAGLSPSDASDTSNWQGGLVPVNNDSIVIDNATSPFLYNTGYLASINIASLVVYSTFSGAGMGFPVFAPEGYRQYLGGRVSFQTLSACQLELPATATPSSFRLNTGSNPCAMVVTGVGNPGIGNEQVDWVGNSNTNSLEVLGAGVTIGALAGDTSIINTIKAVSAAITIGSNVTIGSVSLENSAMDCRSNLPILTIDNGSTLTLREDATLGDVQLDSGFLRHNSSGDITSLKIGSAATADFSGSRDPITITYLEINEGGGFLDPYQRVSFPGGIKVTRTGGTLTGQVTLDLGTNYTLKREAY